MVPPDCTKSWTLFTSKTVPVASRCCHNVWHPGSNNKRSWTPNEWRHHNCHMSCRTRPLWDVVRYGHCTHTLKSREREREMTSQDDEETLRQVRDVKQCRVVCHCLSRLVCFFAAGKKSVLQVCWRVVPRRFPILREGTEAHPREESEPSGTLLCGSRVRLSPHSGKGEAVLYFVTAARVVRGHSELFRTCWPARLRLKV